MPFYRFHIDVDAPPHVVAERLRSVVRDRPGLWDSMWAAWKSKPPNAPPFIGSVYDDSFRVRRDIRYRNSFLPEVWGKIAAVPSGSRVTVIMFMHPLVLAFMLFFLGLVALKAASGTSAHVASQWFVFIFGAVLCISGFVPEAVIAKRLLIAAVLTPEDPQDSNRPLG